MNTAKFTTANDKMRNKNKRILTWKRNIKLRCAAAVVVFVLNLCLLIWAETRSHHASHDSTALVFSGNCNKAQQITLWSPLTINIIGSVLLAAGNTCMQCLTAPTLEEIDQAHAEYTWLDVDVHTVRSLKSISSSRRLLWVCLALSSAPLHLL